MLTKYRKVILFNKNLFISGIVSFLAGGLATQSYALFDRNDMESITVGIENFRAFQKPPPVLDYV